MLEKPVVHMNDFPYPQPDLSCMIPGMSRRFHQFISLGKRPRKSSIRCVGVRPNWRDYPEELQREILRAERVYYPGPVYCEILQALGVAVFPRNYYHFLGNKIAQTDLFNLLEISHPRTRIYYGRCPHNRIETDFSYPLVAKTPFGSSRGEGVFLVSSREHLDDYLRIHNPAYIQEYLPIARDLRVVVLAGNIANAYWRIHRQGEFRNNISRGGSFSFEDISPEALDFAIYVADRCGFDEVGLDICEYAGKHCVLEANMVFGHEGFRKKGLDVYEVIANSIDPPSRGNYRL